MMAINAFLHMALFCIILQGQGIKVVAVGIGTNVNTYELFSMAYDTNHAFTVSSFNTLNSLQTEIKNETCGGKLDLRTPISITNNTHKIVRVKNSASETH